VTSSLRILRVGTSSALLRPRVNNPSDGWLDYRVYERVPRWWRKIEEMLHLDIYLAWRTKQIEQQYDLIWAGSEKVGIPLSLFKLHRPLVVLAHHPESPLKARVVRAAGLAKRWAGVGYISNEGKRFLMDRLGVPADRLFQAESAKFLGRVPPASGPTTGPTMSVGAAKRDYPTLIAALSKLPGYETEIFAASKYGDKLTKQIPLSVQAWIHINSFVSEAELIQHYQAARFVIIPLVATTHGGAGLSAALEASTCGKAVIATRIGGMPTFVKDGETGLLVPPHDVDALRIAIQKLWEQPDLAHQMGLAGRSYLEQNFDPETVQANVQAMLRKIVRERTSGD
jgi:glycosyltransferase involved in cell wall biosynthesis